MLQIVVCLSKIMFTCYYITTVCLKSSELFNNMFDKLVLYEYVNRIQTFNKNIMNMFEFKSELIHFHTFFLSLACTF